MCANSFQEALDALRHADDECYLLEHQDHCVKNTAMLKTALLEHTLCRVVPIPKPKTSLDSCIWRDTTLLRSQQLDTLTILRRLVEHFAAASSSINATRPFDAVRIIVPSAIAAIADAVMRARVSDVPSAFCAHLIGDSDGDMPQQCTRLHEGFGLTTGYLGPQSETIEAVTPELNVARTAVPETSPCSASPSPRPAAAMS